MQTTFKRSYLTKYLTFYFEYVPKLKDTHYTGIPLTVKKAANKTKLTR